MVTGNWCFVENGQVVYAGNIPQNWRNTTNLNLASEEDLLVMGWKPMEEIEPVFDPATQYLGDTVFEIRATKVVATRVILDMSDKQKEEYANPPPPPIMQEDILASLAEWVAGQVDAPQVIIRHNAKVQLDKAKHDF